jgi:DNA-binding NarL/FixJ family response regulator
MSGSNILLIDDAHMKRQCIEHGLRIYAPDFNVESVACATDPAVHHVSMVLLSVKCSGAWADEVRKVYMQIRQLHGDPPVILMVDADDVALVFEIDDCDFHGVLPSSLPMEVAVAAIRLVQAGGRYVPFELISNAGKRCGSNSTGRHFAGNSRAAESTFTRKEETILPYLRRGDANKAIASSLNITESTVKVHVRNIMRKLNVRSRAQVGFLVDEQLSSPRTLEEDQTLPCYAKAS